MPVQVLALSLVAAQLVRAGKVTFDHHFKLSGHARLKSPGKFDDSFSEAPRLSIKQALLLSRYRLVFFKHLCHIVYLGSDAAWRQAFKEHAPVTFRAQARVEHGEHAPVGRAANQPAQALLEADDRLRHAVLVKA